MISDLKTIWKSGRIGQITIIKYLKDIGNLGKRLYKICPDKQFAESLIKLSNSIKEYEKKF